MSAIRINLWFNSECYIHFEDEKAEAVKDYVYSQGYFIINGVNQGLTINSWTPELRFCNNHTTYLAL